MLTAIISRYYNVSEWCVRAHARRCGSHLKSYLLQWTQVVPNTNSGPSKLCQLSAANIWSFVLWSSICLSKVPNQWKSTNKTEKSIYTGQFWYMAWINVWKTPVLCTFCQLVCEKPSIAKNNKNKQTKMISECQNWNGITRIVVVICDCAVWGMKAVDTQTKAENGLTLDYDQQYGNTWPEQT